MTQRLPLSLSGITKRYNGDGRKLGYPTANIDSEVTLDDGIYFGFANLGPYKKNKSLIFIGSPITLGDTKRRVEAYLFDVADIDYYGHELNLDIRHFHRPNQKFKSVEELIRKIKQDEVAAQNWFASKNNL